MNVKALKYAKLISIFRCCRIWNVVLDYSFKSAVEDRLVDKDSPLVHSAVT
jgi:hypothetical protein